MSNSQKWKHRILQIVALAVVVCVALLLWEGGASGTRLGLESSLTSPQLSEVPQLALRESGQAQRVPLGEVEPRDSTEDVLTTLVVIDAESGDRIVGAEVYVATREELLRDRVSVHALPDWEVLLCSVGQRLNSDESGEVTIASYERGLHVCARHAGRFGAADWYELENGGRQLKLFADRALVIRVVNERGLPRSDVLVALDEITGSRGGIGQTRGLLAGAPFLDAVRADSSDALRGTGGPERESATRLGPHLRSPPATARFPPTVRDHSPRSSGDRAHRHLSEWLHPLALGLLP